eukprot:TRINITY_DN80095_c0_g1_i1.p1 TRINITY_DN80095_c0_g1~~TRINITY_DN80095_c0_g1_i1.p1  ORF type:complete len:407 (+),score=76.55 TRINITY_DN80095_c0_g1_i1:39-1259(+)
MWRYARALRPASAGLAVAVTGDRWKRHRQVVVLKCDSQEEELRAAAFKRLQGTSLTKSSEFTKPPILEPEGLVGLYFSAEWCPPCRKFTPLLAECYRELKAAGKHFEVVFVSSDKDEASFAKYLAKMPWLAVPFSEDELRKKLNETFKVQGIPTLVLLKADGSLLTCSGREAVMYGTEFYPWGPEEMRRGESKKEGEAQEALLRALSAERDSVVLQQLRGGPEMKRLRGSPGTSVDHDVPTATVDSKSFATLGAPKSLVTSGVLYYEVEVMSTDGIAQVGFASHAFETWNGDSGSGIGDDDNSWGVDGVRKVLWTKGETQPWDCVWSVGDVIGLAVNVELGKVAVSKNGSWQGIVFESGAIKEGVCPAFTLHDHKVRYNLDGASHGPFRFEKPPATIWAEKACVRS